MGQFLGTSSMYGHRSRYTKNWQEGPHHPSFRPTNPIGFREDLLPEQWEGTPEETLRVIDSRPPAFLNKKKNLRAEGPRVGSLFSKGGFHA